MVGMVGIGDRVEERVESRDAADILGRAVHGTVDEARIGRSRIGGEQLLDLKSMLPAVAHVVNIGEALYAPRGEILEADPTRAHGAGGTEPFAPPAGPPDPLPAALETEKGSARPAPPPPDAAT